MKLHLTIDLDQYASKNEYDWTYINMEWLKNALMDIAANCPSDNINRDELPWHPTPTPVPGYPDITCHWELEDHD